MTKLEVIDRKLLKSAKKWQNPGYRGKRITDFEFSRVVQVLIHTRRHLGEGFRKFSAKTNDNV